MSGVEALGIRKYFPANGVEALSEVSFDLRPGEIHALVGENGAGKSTLMHVLAGIFEPSAGALFVDGTERRFSNPGDALRAGIGLVRQHPQVVPGFALWEDCVLGAEPAIRGVVRRAAARKTVGDLSCRWGFDLDPDARTDSLAVSQRQKAAVLSLLMRGVRYLLLDEPTAVLAPQETERLFSLLRVLKGEGAGIVLISHKLPETLEVADRITVLRRGALAGTVTAAGTDAEALRGMMFGPTANSSGAGSSPEPAAGEPALRIRGLATAGGGHPLLRGIDLDLRKGEILGVAGVRESGLGTLELAAAGMLRPKAGSIELLGSEIGGRGTGRFGTREGYTCRRTGWASPRAAAVPGRQPHQSTPAAEEAPNCGSRTESPDQGDTRSGPGIRRSPGTGQLLFRRNPAAADTRPGIRGDPEFVLLSEPGWGLDAASKAELDRRIRRLAAAGKAVLLLSTDLDELTTLCGTVAVLRDGRVSGRFSRSDFSRSRRIPRSPRRRDDRHGGVR
jgi:simple sugar transport system ATP-binding protein